MSDSISLWNTKRQARGLSFGQLNAIVEPVAPDYRQDEVFRSDLAKGLKAEYSAEFAAIPVEKLAKSLKAVMGAQELRHVLANELQQENFLHGDNYQNVINGTYRANLHMHTRHSDGDITVKELLDQAETYAKYRKTLGKTDPVIVGITDHDTLNGAKEAIKIIAQNPEKYSNIRFVPGIEFSTFLQEGENRRKPFEALGYAVNPFKMSAVGRFVEEIQAKNAAYLEQLIMKGPDREGQPGVPDEKTGGLYQWEANAGIPEDQRTTIDKIKTHSSHLKSLGSPGFMPGLVGTLKKTFEKRGWRYSPQREQNGINVIIRRHNSNYGSLNINPGSREIKDIAAVVKASGQGFIGVSHPCRDFHGYDLRNVFPRLSNMGVRAVEANYVYKSTDGVNGDFVAHACYAADLSGMLKAGGNDNHKDNILGGREYDFKTLPNPVKDILNRN